MHYKYKKLITTGPYGTVISHNSSDENKIITLGDIEDCTYIFAENLGDQPEQLEFEEIELSKSELEYLTNNDVYIKGLEFTTQAQIDHIGKSYPQFERDTFATQEREANAYMKDSTAPTPFIDNLCLNRGIDKEIMVAKILANAEALKLATAPIIGHYQKVVSTK
ncbi:hypothetical protein QUR76_06205 [Arcobacter cryaerophilus gv. pseudocryaerophilus]|uniref:Uncharacterized protein n=3 Tax=unclassified Arcobacter TaxID=2593671 RepID=A0AA96DP23_9BACT|nr:hypothetical protein RMQ65_01890 [Arcobacter sp. AZ-2023]WPD04717.1 hypothetical protein QUR76_06205 [Arcobacter sp. DSM 115956]WPD06812.1 hypothetical protein QUR78_06205 [Arcobacter sp. DSM 115955]WNL31077.1 hypothetical protein RMQ67_06205 [Arcobacter sp. AZ-2023]WNP37227.1 hypothetical protein RJG58_06205 [Arcobacter sp. AZ-2023]